MSTLNSLPTEADFGSVLFEFIINNVNSQDELQVLHDLCVNLKISKPFSHSDIAFVLNSEDNANDIWEVLNFAPSSFRIKSFD